VAEAPAEISSEGDFGGIAAYVVTSCPLLYRLERVDGRWYVFSLDVVYKRDSVVPVTVGDTPSIDRDALSGFRVLPPPGLPTAPERQIGP
jgi:hypothetical protein